MASIAARALSPGVCLCHVMYACGSPMLQMMFGDVGAKQNHATLYDTGMKFVYSQSWCGSQFLIVRALSSRKCMPCRPSLLPPNVTARVDALDDVAAVVTVDGQLCATVMKQ